MNAQLKSLSVTAGDGPTRPLVQTLLFPLASRFVAGDCISDAFSVVKRLHDDGFTATIDVLREHVRDEHGADLTRDSYFALIDRCRKAKLATNLSVNLSALGLGFADGGTISRLTSILGRAIVLPDPFVQVDMEDLTLVPRALETVMAAFVHHRNVGITLEACLYRTQADVQTLNDLGMRVRLCKGAYREPGHVALRKSAAIQGNFLICASALLREGRQPTFATHDDHLIREVCRIAGESGVPKSAFEFQMLYGVRPELQASLVREGYAVRVYVPYGSYWARYVRRRILERPENSVLALRSVFAAR